MKHNKNIIKDADRVPIGTTLRIPELTPKNKPSCILPAFGINKAGKIQEVKKVRSTDILTLQTLSLYFKIL